MRVKILQQTWCTLFLYIYLHLGVSAKVAPFKRETHETAILLGGGASTAEVISAPDLFLFPLLLELGWFEQDFFKISCYCGEGNALVGMAKQVEVPDFWLRSLFIEGLHLFHHWKYKIKYLMNVWQSSSWLDHSTLEGNSVLRLSVLQKNRIEFHGTKK